MLHSANQHGSIMRQALPNVLRIMVFFCLAVAAGVALAAGGALPVAPREPAPGALSDIRRFLPAGFDLKTPASLPPVKPLVFSHGARTEARIALSFDACATRTPSGYDERIPAVLLATGTPATLFLGGKWMAEHADATRFLGRQPLFELGNHSFLHPHLMRASEERVREEILWTQMVMFSLTGRQATLMRAPYGEYDARVAAMAGALGLSLVQYDLPSGDPDPQATEERLIEAVARNARNGSIVVMHMNGRGWNTAAALPAIIARLTRRGFRFATVGELMRAAPQVD
jgi:peptidoglycan/xylan/chitin deacetylase (PgdA/CDA1 family)